ncbi:MAG: hypothetical protein ABSC61_05710 [Anaerolineales bacterium]
MNPISETGKNLHRHHGLGGGIALVLIGTALLMNQWMDIGSYLVLLVGAGFLVWGALSRTGGLIIPGGVLTGIGLGILVYEERWSIPVANPNGLFLICFALGWFLIPLLTGLFTSCTQWWPIVPGGIMAILGAAVLWRGDPRVWQDYSGCIVSLILILLGVHLIVRRGRPNTRC